ncbi:ergot alkaloid biosynthesis protein [Mycolicibacterium sp. S2-37]|uniref:NAD-dependent epimerase/dehydratase family protein n=1 Tax=Mycolicibacterium sp. S2-37 TaxID=2810297 RepID=UPI001A93CEC2|nr:NAD-dependent epimerase/dehydratase family protein [Mycolicibacterium sp. S2-37]MBO0681281.1 ergot alkaloid biosynthesis protein [Mycolicibacterium sp. S2-37]
MTGPLLVTGATGHTGSAVSRLLREAGAEVRTASRDPGRAAVRFDWTDRGTYADALAGVERMYLVAPVGVAEPAPVVRPFLEMGLARGLRRVALLSSSATEPADHGLGALYRLVTDTVPEPVVLRPSWFMTNFVGDHPVALGMRTGTVTTATGAGRIGFVDVEDIAAVAAHTLLDDAVPDPEYLITGPEALSYADVCSLATELTGRTIQHVAVSTAERAEQIAASGVPRDFAVVLAAMDEAISRGSEDRVTDTVPRITGRPARSVADFLAAHVDQLDGMESSPPRVR